MAEKYDHVVLSSASEKDLQREFCSCLKTTPIPDDELLANLGMFLTSKTLSRVLFFYEMYQKILHTHGAIIEFGVRWGQTLSILSALRGIFEPYNRHRKMVGFDTFEGFKGVSDLDGIKSGCKNGSFSVPAGYEETLAKILGLQDAMNPIPHLKKYDIVKGDAVGDREHGSTIENYFFDHPEMLVSMAIFDFDIYHPTAVAMKAIKPRLFKGSVLIFDELSDDIFPGETAALQESFNINDLRIQRFPMTARVSYAVIE
jgi:hypothetical protein